LGQLFKQTQSARRDHADSFWRSFAINQSINQLIDQSRTTKVFGNAGNSSNRFALFSLGTLLHDEIDLMAGVHASSFLILTIFCLGYELQRSRTASTGSGGQEAAVQPSKKPRLPLWDIMRFTLEFTVIFHHVLGGTSETAEVKKVNPFEPNLPPLPCILPTHMFLDNMERTFRPLRMGCFAMVSGVFGASMERESFSKMFCYTIGTSCLAGVFYSWSNFDPMPSKVMHLWYLMSMLLWRLTITPTFYALRQKLGMPTVVPLLASNLMLHVARHLELVTLEQGWYGIFFAVGLCFSAGEWTKIMLHPGALVGSLGVLFCHYGMIFSTPLDPWLCVSHAAPRVVSDTISFTSFLKDTMLGGLQSCLVLSALVTIANASTLFSKTLPSCCDFVAGCGSRTLYAYVLHMFVVSAAKDLKLDIPPIAFSMWLNVILCMRGSEYLFKWLLLPYWILDAGAWLTTASQIKR
jgi:uncharacterized membrane protein YagU involved in acid resistance